MIPAIVAIWVIVPLFVLSQAKISCTNTCITSSLWSSDYTSFGGLKIVDIKKRCTPGWAEYTPYKNVRPEYGLFLSGVIRRVNKRHAPWPDSMNLHDGFFRRPAKMVRLRWHNRDP